MSTRTYHFLSACIETLHHSEGDSTKIDYWHPTSNIGQPLHLVHRLSANSDIIEWQSHNSSKLGIRIECMVVTCNYNKVSKNSYAQFFKYNQQNSV